MVFIRFWSKKECFDNLSFEEKQPKRQFEKLRIVIWHPLQKEKTEGNTRSMMRFPHKLAFLTFPKCF